MAFSAPPPSPAPTGELLAERYRLDRRIGQGGMAEVWVATDIDLDRKVAVKWLKTNLATDPVVAERFRREAIAVARLSHPNIVAVHDVFVHDGRQAVVMQLVDGKSLRQLLDGQKRLGPELTIHIGAAIAGALDEAHRSGFVHRDVKPGNILVTSDGRVLLADFGIAKGLQAGDEDLTSDNVMMGTAKYLSPEQVRGKRLDGRADIYALGLVLYECLAGRVPFLGESDADTALARLQRDPTDLGQLRPTLPVGLVNLIHTTLARNPAHRPQTGSELRTALIGVDTSPPQIDGTPAEPPPSIANPPDRRAEARRAAVASIPGEVGHSGAVPITATDRTPQPPETATGDDTPPASRPIRGTPARQDQQRWAPSLMTIGGLLTIAAVMALILWIVVRSGGDDTGLSSDTVVPEATAAAPAPTTAPPAPSGPLTIAGVTSWDPDGTNGQENDSQATLALADGVASTAWATECYSDKFMGGKRGVGLIIELSFASSGTLSVDTVNAPYQLDVFATTATAVPTDLDGWQQIGPTAFADEPGTITAAIDATATHVMVWLKELGPDDACSSTNPFRGQLGEISYRP